MATKRNRDTANACTAAKIKREARRQTIRKIVLDEICTEFCNCPASFKGCRSGDPPNAVILLGCVYQKSIANHLNAHNIPMLSGKTGKWQVSTVGNLFREEKKQLGGIRPPNLVKGL